MEAADCGRVDAGAHRATGEAKETKGKSMKTSLNEFSQGLDKWNRVIDILERFGISQLVRLSTYLGPAVPAYFVYEAAMVHLTHNWAKASFTIALVLELLGLGVIYNLNNLFEWNRKYAAEQVSTTGAQWLVFFYATQICVIVFGLKIYPEAFLWLAIFGLSSLSILTGFAYSQGQQHKARIEAKEKTEQLAEQENEAKRKLDAELREQRLRMELDIAKLRAQSELEIERKKAEVELQAKLMKAESKLHKPVEKSSKQVNSKVIQSSDSVDNIESKIITYYRMNPLSSQRKAANDLVLSQAKVNRILADLESRKVIHRNGNGVEVLS